jgi:hypothetical protein
MKYYLFLMWFQLWNIFEFMEWQLKSSYDLFIVKINTGPNELMYCLLLQYSQLQHELLKLI